MPEGLALRVDLAIEANFHGRRASRNRCPVYPAGQIGLGVLDRLGALARLV